MCIILITRSWREYLGYPRFFHVLSLSLSLSLASSFSFPLSSVRPSSISCSLYEERGESFPLIPFIICDMKDPSSRRMKQRFKKTLEGVKKKCRPGRVGVVHWLRKNKKHINRECVLISFTKLFLWGSFEVVRFWLPNTGNVMDVSTFEELISRFYWHIWLKNRKKKDESKFPHCFLACFIKFLLWECMLFDFDFFAEQASWIHPISKSWCHCSINAYGQKSSDLYVKTCTS